MSAIDRYLLIRVIAKDNELNLLFTQWHSLLIGTGKGLLRIIRFQPEGEPERDA